MGEFNLHPANENVNVKTIPISLNMELCVVCQQKVENGFAVERGAVQPVWGKKEKKTQEAISINSLTVLHDGNGNVIRYQIKILGKQRNYSQKQYTDRPTLPFSVFLNIFPHTFNLPGENTLCCYFRHFEEKTIGLIALIGQFWA